MSPSPVRVRHGGRAVPLFIALLVAATGTLLGLTPATPVAAATTSVTAGDGGLIATTLTPAANAFPTGTGAQRLISRDCGHSVEVPGRRALWLFCDTAVYDHITTSGTARTARLGFVNSGTAGLTAITTDPTPTNPVRVTEAAYPAQPTQFITSSSTYGTQDRTIPCPNGAVAFAWTKSMVTLPGTSTVLAFFQDHCANGPNGSFPSYDVGVGELTLPDVADGDVSGGATLKVERQYDSVQVNPTPGEANEHVFSMGAVVDGAYLYLYGVRPMKADCSSGTCRTIADGAVEVARVAWADGGYRSQANYRYYTGQGTNPWSTDPTASVNVLPDSSTPAGDGMMVKWQPEIGRYVMIHADSPYSTVEGADLRTSPTPWGPWSAPVLAKPTAGSAKGYPTRGCSAPVTCRSYKLHPELSGGDKLWFSYVREGDLADANGTPVTVNGDAGQTVRLASIPFSSLPTASGPLKPLAPSGVAATAGDGRATVSWTAPTPLSGATIVGYRVTPYLGSTALDPVAFSGSTTSGVVLGLDNTKAYSFTVAAVSADAVGPASARSAVVTPKGSPRAPIGVTVTAVGDTEVDLSWTAPANTGGAAITGYRVTPYKNGVAQAARVLTQTATTKDIGSLSNGASYAFTVQAVTSLGTSAESSATPAVTPYGLAGAPTGVSAVPRDGAASVSWTAPTSTNGAAITGYTVTPYVGTTAQAPTVLSTTGTSTTVSGLRNGTAYTFKVAATNARGTGTASTASAAVTPRTLAGAPTGLAVTPGNGQVALSWTAPADTGGAPITGYEVTPSVDGVFGTPKQLTGTGTTTVMTGLTNGKVHRFVVRAVTAAGLGASSDFSPPATPRTTAGAPTGLSVTAGNGQVTIAFTAPTADGGAPVSGYRITPYVGSTAQAPRDVAYVTSHIVGGLTNGTAYTFTVQALNAAGAGAAARSAVATPRTLPGAPGAPSATPANGAATVSWSAPTEDGGGAVTGYQITPWVGSTAQSPRVFSGSTATSQVISGLTNGTSYRFVVRAVNAAGPGAQTDFSNAVTPAASVAPSAPGAPAGLTTAPGNGQVTVSFSAPASNGGSAVTGYKITPYVGSTAGPVRTVGAATTHVVSGLENGTAYTFVVQAVNAVGTGTGTRSGSATPRTTAGAPTAVTAEGGSASATVSWAPPTATGGATITGYSVTPWVGGSAQAARTFTTAATTQVISGLANGTSYRFAVRAINAAGPGAASDFSGVATPAASTPTQSSSPYPSWEAMVDGLFRSILDRPPATSERSSWVERLSGGSATAGELVVSLRGMDDQASVVDPVGRLYRAYFLRPPDAGGLTYWVGQRRSGRSLGWVSQQFARSKEFTTMYGSLSDEGFMDLVYRQVLERAPDASGKAFWVEQLRSGKRTRGTVMTGFSEAAEYKAKYGSTVEASIAHLRLLGRAPSKAEAAAWVSAVAGGATTASRYEALLDTTEYANRVR